MSVSRISEGDSEMTNNVLRTQHPRALYNSDIFRMAARRTAAQTEINRICGGDRSFTMSIPVHDSDSDIVLSNALNDSLRLEQEVYRLRGQIQQAIADAGTSPGMRDMLLAILYGTGDEPGKDES
jgi:hypothetical protein